MDVSSQDLATLWFFEYALGLAEEIFTRISQYTHRYLDNITPLDLPQKPCSTMCRRGNNFLYPGA